MDPDMKDGDIVWKSWNNLFWPCILHTMDKLISSGVQISNRFVGAVEFFGDKKYSYLTSRSKVYPYNCKEKPLFIKKGVKRQQTNDTYMTKFLQDVKIAEVRTNGNVNILSLPEFQFPTKITLSQNKQCVFKEESSGAADKVEALSNSQSESRPPNVLVCAIKEEEGLLAQNKRHIVTDAPVNVNQSGTTQETSSKRIKLDNNVEGKDDEVSSDDDSLVDALNYNSGTRDKDFVVDQIVLVPWRKKGYFPAFVTKVIKRKKKNVVYLKYVNGPRQEKSFRKDASCLLDFRDFERNQAMREAAALIEPSSIEAYDRCLQYLSIRTNRIKDLQAFRFLTRHPNDLHYGIIPDSDLPISVKNLCLEQNSEEMEEISNLDTSSEDSSSDEEVVNKDDIASATPYIPTPQLSKEELLTTMEEAAKLLKVIKSDNCLAHLKSILDGTVPSWRHKVFHNGTLDERNDLRGSSGMGVFYDKEQSFEMLSFLRENVPRIESVDKGQYMLNVWLPEAIIYALKRVHSIDQSDAERRLTTTSCLSLYIDDLRRGDN